MVGLIFLSKIFFTDFSDFKIRPVLVVKESELDYFCFPLTTNLDRKGLMIDSGDLIFGNLKSKSVVIIPKILTLHRDVFIKHIATLNNNKLMEIKEDFCKEFGC